MTLWKLDKSNKSTDPSTNEFSKHDGSTPAKAIIVNSVAAEYDWIRQQYPGFKPIKQLLRRIGGKSYDVLVIQGISGKTRELYFDISSFFE